MSALINPAASRGTLAGSRSTLLLGASGFLRDLVREWQVRRAIQRAQALDEGALRDIGMNRGGIEDAVRHGRRGIARR